MKKEFTIKSDYINSRLDRWLRKNVNVPQSLIEKNIRIGNIKVNNNKEKSSYKLKNNDLITIFNFKFVPNKNKKFTQSYEPTKKDLSIQNNLFIEDNENFVIINKPYGVSVQQGTKSRRNIIDILKETKPFVGLAPYPVHRIDKDTTGILIVAKNRKYAQIFTALFRKRMIHKTYLCIVKGEVNKNKGTFVDELISFEGKRKIKNKAITHFNLIGTNGKYSLLKLNPETGRKHQLRRQMLMHGFPILGDEKYNIKTYYNNKKKMHLMLHAYKINFSIENIKYNFLADVPNEFDKIIKEKYLKNFL